MTEAVEISKKSITGKSNGKGRILKFLSSLRRKSHKNKAQNKAKVEIGGKIGKKKISIQITRKIQNSMSRNFFL